MDMTFAETVGRVWQAIDATGVAIIVVGMLYATVLYPRHWHRRPPEAQYRRYR